MPTNESVAAEIAVVIHKLNDARTFVLAGRDEDLGIANLIVDGLLYDSVIGAIGTKIQRLYRQVKAEPPPDDQLRRCEGATVEAFKREPCKGVVVDEIG